MTERKERHPGEETATEQRRRRALSSPPYIEAAANRAAASAREILGSERFDVLSDEGHTLTLDQAIAYALDEV
jgi:hypothetical protein